MPTHEIGEAVRETQKNIVWLAKRGDPGTAMWGSASVEACLTNLIAIHMPSLSRRMHQKLFVGYGPLSSFSAKLDLAYCLGHIPNNLRRNLHAIRKVRNAFAHATDLFHFNDTQFNGDRGRIA